MLELRVDLEVQDYEEMMLVTCMFLYGFKQTQFHVIQNSEILCSWREIFS